MSTQKNLLSVMESHRGEKHIIVLHEYPDPESIASGYAHKIISNSFDIEIDIIYTGTVSHPQNKALICSLDCNLIPYESGFSIPIGFLSGVITRKNSIR